MQIAKPVKKTISPALAMLITNVPLDHIAQSTEIPMRPLDKDWVTELAADIEANGMINPLITWDGGGPNVQTEIAGKSVPCNALIAGQHRREALKLLRKRNKDRFNALFSAGIPVIRRSGTVVDAILTELKDNVQRRDMPAEEILPFFELLRSEKYKLKNKEIAARIGRSEPWVSGIVKIQEELGEEGIEEVKKGGLTIEEARKAADEARKEKKAGKVVNAKSIVQAAKKKAVQARSKGGKRADKRHSLQKLWDNYKTLPVMGLGAQLQVLKGIVAYVLKEEDKVPDEVDPDKD